MADGRWPRGDRKYEGAVLIIVPVTTGYAVSDSCLFSLEAMERAMRAEFSNTQQMLYISSSFVPKYEIFKGKKKNENFIKNFITVLSLY